jgi:hypothetical protein
VCVDLVKYSRNLNGKGRVGPEVSMSMVSVVGGGTYVYRLLDVTGAPAGFGVICAGMGTREGGLGALFDSTRGWR